MADIDTAEPKVTNETHEESGAKMEMKDDIASIAGPNAIDITPNKDGGVFKVIKKEGTGHDGPLTGDNVEVHYVGTLTDGTKFDSSRDRNEKFDFQLGTGNVIKAWDLCVATMKRGEVCLVTCRSDYAYGDRGSPPKIAPKATLIFEIELFDWKGEDISENKDGSILKSTLIKGEDYDSPNDGSTVDVHLVGRYNGEVFDERDVTFILGEGSESNVVQGVETAVSKFTKNERSLLKLAAYQAYGDTGYPEKNIPGGAKVEYEVTLKQFEKAKESWELDPEEKVEQSEIMKTKGTNFFKAGKIKLAKGYYQKIVEFLEEENALEGESLLAKRNSLLLAANLNLAMCHLKLKDYYAAAKSCDKALELDKKNEKGLFRRGQAKFGLQEFQDAIKDFNAVLEVDPKNKAARNQITIVNQKIKKLKEEEKKRYGGMFQKFAQQDAKLEAMKPKIEKEENGESQETMEVESSEQMEVGS